MIGSTNLTRRIGLDVDILQVNTLTNTITSQNNNTVIRSIDNVEIMKDGRTDLATIEYNTAVSNVWSISKDMNTHRGDLAGNSDGSNAYALGGKNPSSVLRSTEKFNGTVWANDENTLYPRYCSTATGVTGNMLVTGGRTDTGTDMDATTTEIFNGTWALKTRMSRVRMYLASVGTTDNALAMSGTGGETAGAVASTEKLNGNSWSTDATMTIARRGLDANGSVNSTLAINGFDYVNGTHYTSTEKFNGLSWSTSADTNVWRVCHVSDGSFNDTIAMGGYDNYYRMIALDSTEKFNGVVWSNSDKMIIAKRNFGGGTLSDGMIVFGGYDSDNNILKSTELYNNKITPKFKQLYIQKIIPETIALKKDESIAIFEIKDESNNTFSGEWSIKALLNVSRESAAGCGSVNNLLIAGGNNDGELSSTERFDGIVWITGNNMIIKRSQFSVCGTTYSAIAFGSSSSKKSEKFNGLTWASLNDLNTRRSDVVGCGNTASAIAICGDGLSANNVSTEILLGGASVWSIGSNTNMDRSRFAGVGTSEYAFIFGGTIGDNEQTLTNNDEILKNKVWSINPIKMNINRAYHTGCGTIGKVLAVGGNSMNSVEKFVKNVWTIDKPTNTNKQASVGYGSINDALACGGGSSITEMFMRAPFNKGEWKTSANTNVIRYGGCGVGNGNNSALLASAAYYTEKLLVNIWSTRNYLNINRSNAAAAGTTNNVIVFGGKTETPNSFSIDSIEKFNGYIWIEDARMNNKLNALSGCGISNNAIAIGGIDINSKTTSYSSLYNGITWSVSNELNSIISHGSSCGTGSNALSFGGQPELRKPTSAVEKFNGISWYTFGDMNIARHELCSSGTPTNAMSIAGLYSNTTEKFNNITWNIANNTNMCRGGSMGCGTTFNSIIATGVTTNMTTAASASTEQYTMTNSVFPNIPNIIDIVSNNPVTPNYFDI